MEPIDTRMKSNRQEYEEAREWLRQTHNEDAKLLMSLIDFHQKMNEMNPTDDIGIYNLAMALAAYKTS